MRPLADGLDLHGDPQPDGVCRTECRRSRRGRRDVKVATGKVERDHEPGDLAVAGVDQVDRRGNGNLPEHLEGIGVGDADRGVERAERHVGSEECERDRLGGCPDAVDNPDRQDGAAGSTGRDGDRDRRGGEEDVASGVGAGRDGRCDPDGLGLEIVDGDVHVMLVDSSAAGWSA